MAKVLFAVLVIINLNAILSVAAQFANRLECESAVNYKVIY